MRKLYLRKENIKNSDKRSEYLTSKDKQEHLFAYTKLELLPEFKNINKELVIEIPNEIFKDNEKHCEEVLKFYISEFKRKTKYEHVAGALHLNKDKTNFHIHLSYVDRIKLEDPIIAKKDLYFYTSTGKKLKKNEYKEDNPNHLKIKVGESIPNFKYLDKNIAVYRKEYLTSQNIPLEKRMAFRDEIRANLTISDSRWSKCIESGLDFNEQKKKINEYKDFFTELSNEILTYNDYEEKYVYDYPDWYLPHKKIGKIKNDTLSELQIQLIEYNNLAEIYNLAVEERRILPFKNETKLDFKDMVVELRTKLLDSLEGYSVENSFDDYIQDGELLELDTSILDYKVGRSFESIENICSHHY